MSVFLQPIYTQTVGAGGAASITFNNIPQGFTDLKIVVSGKTGFANDSYILRFNNDTTNDYSWTRVYGTGSGATSDRTTNVNYIIGPSITTGANPASTFGNAEFYISSYAGGNFKQVFANGVSEANTTAAYQMLNSGIWNDTSPITSLTLSSFYSSTFAQYSTFTLYGLSNVYDTRVPLAPTLGTVTDLAGFFSVAFTPAANDGADTYWGYSPAAITSPTYGATSPIVVGPFESQFNYNATNWVAAVNSLGVTPSATVSSGNVTSNNYASIATVTNSSAGGFNALFTNIPQYYTHLQIRLIGRASSASAGAPVYIQMNGDTGNNYSWHYMIGNGSSVTAGGLSPYGDIEGMGMVISGNLANAQCVYLIDIADYTNLNKMKALKATGGYDLNGSGYVNVTDGIYNNYAPITTLNVQAYAGFTQYSHIALYGIG